MMINKVASNKYFYHTIRQCISVVRRILSSKGSTRNQRTIVSLHNMIIIKVAFVFAGIIIMKARKCVNKKGNQLFLVE